MDKRLLIVDHPLVAHRMASLRAASTDQATFARLVHQITSVLALEAFRDLPTEEVVIDTPVFRGALARHITVEVVIIPILRAGLGLVPALQEALPDTRVCHIGMRRNEVSLEADIYLDAIPRDLTGAKVVICDPMMATSGSLVQVVELVKARGATDVTVICIVASASGLEAFRAAVPDVMVVTAAVDPTLNEHGYIIPGLGDAGDRLFGAPVRP